MRSISLIFFSVFLLSTAVLAQSEDGQRTLFGDFSIHSSGGYGGPAMRLSAIGGDFAAFFGGYGAWFINRQFSVGGGGYGLVSGLAVPEGNRIDPNLDLHYDMGYGGFMFGYTIASDNLLHIHTDVLVGGGGIEQDFEGEAEFSDTYSNFFVFEPGIYLELNVATFMRATSGLTYRAVSGSDTRGMRDSDLSGMSLALSLKFGYFD